MNKARVLISIDGSAPIANNEFFDVSIYSAIDYTLPELTFKVRDEMGLHLSSFDIHPGAKVNVRIEDYDNSDDYVEFTNFSVTEIYDGSEFKNEHLGGFIQVWAKQSWEFYGDWTSHAYPPMKLSELIKKVCSGANKLAGIKVDQKNFKISSDAGNMPRYKENMSEVDFIEQRCLPYLNVDESCGFFYVDFYGDAHVSSFSEMYSQAEKVIISQPASQANNVEDYKKITESGAFTSAYSYAQIKTGVGSKDISNCIGKLRQKCFFEDDSTGKFATGTSMPNLKIKSSNGNTIKDRIPINAIKFANVDAFATQSFTWHNLNDGIAVSNNQNIEVVDFIRANVLFENFPTDIRIGETLYLFTPKFNVTGETKKNEHWVKGKWLVASMNIGVQVSDGAQIVSTEVTLISPTLDVNSDTTTVLNPNDFYKVT